MLERVISPRYLLPLDDVTMEKRSRNPALALDTLRSWAAYHLRQHSIEGRSCGEKVRSRVTFSFQH